jgi:cholesterol transport system auxiliary component
MNRVCIALAVCMLAAALSALGGCASVARQDAFPQRYTLDVSAAQAASGTPAPMAGQGAVLRVARVEMPAWLQGDGLYYRLDYGNWQRVAAYANSTWASPPAGMLEQLIRKALGADGSWQAVVGPDSDAQARFTLRVEVGDFSQVFVTPQTSFGVLGATATLVAARTAKVVAQRSFHVQVPASGADAAGGAAALGAASRDFTRQLRVWLRDQAMRKP